MEICITREGLYDLLNQSLRSVYQFEQTKVLRFGLTYEGLYLLLHLEENPNSQIGDVAKEMKIPISTLSRIAGRLEEKGFISRQKDDSDKRIIRLSLETEGDNIVKEVKKDVTNVIFDNIMNFSEKELEAFHTTAKSLGQILKTSEDDI